ncbi:hypothetical protein [Vreelandella titanicae]|uniref:Uncharacterized protein n=1 Tax=Vreelandella titanicae TaxID=664683 RepID=A0A558J6W6_9GAMM|nr:hypothetical protein [Halomonas titanicae]TVU89391.1 hypothetical protein FQP89_15475 [Halomonas titanicae]
MNEAEQEPDPIRRWAVKVLQNPISSPQLSDEAAAQLSQDPSLLAKVELRKAIQQMILTYALEDIKSQPQDQSIIEDSETQTHKE